MAHHAKQVERDRRKTRRRDRADIDRRALFVDTLFARLHVVMLARLQAAFAGPLRVALADEIERAGKNDRHQTAEHHRRQDLREHVTLRLVHDFRISDRERDRPFPDAARHDRHHDKEERVVGAEAE